MPKSGELRLQFELDGTAVAEVRMPAYGVVEMRIPDALGQRFRRHLGSDSGSIRALVPEHLGTDSGALGHPFRPHLGGRMRS